MPLFTQYTKPGVYTSVLYEEAGVSLFGNARIPVLIAEGQETLKLTEQELHRGSSSSTDERRVLENLSHQVVGARTYKVTYGPITDGNGKGTVSTNPKDLQAYTTDAQGTLIPLRVTYLSGSTREFMTEAILPLGSELKVSYSFKNMDTQIEDDLSAQIPVYAEWTATIGAVANALTLVPTLPGASGNRVTVAITLAAAGSGVDDPMAITGIGTDAISIEARRKDGTVRTVGQIKSLIEAADPGLGVPTASAGLLTVKSLAPAATSVAATAVAALAFAGGAGPNTNTTFQVKNVPIVDGSNGGVVLSAPADTFVVTVNGSLVTVVAVDGTLGHFTLAQGVAAGSSLHVSYYTNTFQDTSDLLPAESVAAILQAGFAPGHSDFVDGVDFALVDNQIHWGAAAVAKQGSYTPGYTPFDPQVVTPTLVDEKVYLRPCTGVSNGVNTLFTLEDVPTDGSQRSHCTNNPDLINVFVGRTPLEAYAAGAKRVIRVDGSSKVITLYDAPTAGMRVFATYWRGVLNDHTYTMKVVNPGITGQGTYTITDENGATVPVVSPGAHVVTEANFAQTGIVWPRQAPDLRGVAGQTPAETVTLTFLDDVVGHQTQAPIQAVCDTAQTGLRFRATNFGTGPNSASASVVDSGKPSIRFTSSTAVADDAAVTVTGEAISININRDTNASSGGATRTLGEIAAYFASNSVSTTLLGRVICELNPATTSTDTVCSSGSAAAFVGGDIEKTLDYAVHYRVTSSRTAQDALVDGFGRTGGATTPASGIPTEGAEGWLGQTFMDTDTGFQVTIVDPDNALGYGYLELPSPSYNYQPGDKLVFHVAPAAAHTTSVRPNIAIPGLATKVTTTYGMHAGDTLILTTYNKAGNEPKIGEFYYVDLLLNKSEAEFGLRTYTDSPTVLQNYGDAVPENRASLAAKLMFENGASIIAIRQVKKATGLEVATDQSYINAIAELALPLPGSDRKCDVIIPMTTSAVVQQALGKHLITQASTRNRGEAIGFIGLPMYATPESARALARSLNSERLILAYPGGAIISVDVNGVATEYGVDGSFIAAAMAGLYLNPANDVATTLTGQKVTGFSRLIRRTDPTIQDLVAADGVTVLTEVTGALEISHYRTTSTDSVLKVEPTTTTIMDYTRQLTRSTLKQFVGRKGVQAIVTDITIALNSLMGSLVAQEILASFSAPKVVRDKSDPTVVHVTVPVNPMFSVLWLDVTFKVSIKG